MADKNITVHNGARGAYITSKGKLLPGKSQTLPEAEAKKLMQHRGIADAASIVNSVEVEKENSSIRAELVELKGQIAAVNAEKAELVAAVAALEGEGKALEKQVKALQNSVKK